MRIVRAEGRAGPDAGFVRALAERLRRRSGAS